MSNTNLRDRQSLITSNSDKVSQSSYFSAPGMGKSLWTAKPWSRVELQFLRISGMMYPPIATACVRVQCKYKSLLCEVPNMEAFSINRRNDDTQTYMYCDSKEKGYTQATAVAGGHVVMSKWERKRFASKMWDAGNPFRCEMLSVASSRQTTRCTFLRSFATHELLAWEINNLGVKVCHLLSCHMALCWEHSASSS